MIEKCNQETEIYSRITGYHRPLKNWNAGKVSEFKERKHYKFKVVFDENKEAKIEDVKRG